MNTIVQGSASEIIKLAMISMSEAIDGASEAYWQNLPRPELVATIHDELLYTVHRSLVPALVRTLRRVMENEVPAKFSLPLKFEVTVSSGNNWGSLVECE